MPEQSGVAAARVLSASHTWSLMGANPLAMCSLRTVLASLRAALRATAPVVDPVTTTFPDAYTIAVVGCGRRGRMMHAACNERGWVRRHESCVSSRSANVESAPPSKRIQCSTQTKQAI